MGVVVCHDGKVYTYKAGDKIFTSGLLDKRIDKYKKQLYILSGTEAHIKALKEFEAEYGIQWREH